MRPFILLFLLLGMPFHAAAVTLQAEAKAPSEQQARREALAALADSILVEVRSESSSVVKGTGERNEELRISSRSDIPLIGVEFTVVQAGSEVLCEARLDGAKSLPLYAKKLNELQLEIGALDQSIAKAEMSDRYMQLTHALTLIEQHEKYRAVAQLLGGAQFAPLPRSRSETESQLRVMEKAAHTIELAAQLLAKGLKVEAVYSYPAVPHGSHEVTALGRVVRDRLQQRLPSVDSPDKAKNYLKGEYEILDNGIHLTYRLLDNRGNTIETRVATLAPSAYAGLQFKPVTTDFDRLLHEGVAVSSDFRAQITSNRGAEDLLFDEHEDIELFVKLSRPGYFYVVGYVVKPTENYSYLLELSESSTDRRFVRYVNADDVNKWLSIGKFEVAPPFGTESIQLIASSDDPIDRLPSQQRDKTTDLYVTASNAQEGVAKTRALKPKRRESDKQYQTEAVLMFTTMAKNPPWKR